MTNDEIHCAAAPIVASKNLHLMIGKNNHCLALMPHNPKQERQALWQP
jgi:hypothetical protein